MELDLIKPVELFSQLFTTSQKISRLRNKSKNNEREKLANSGMQNCRMSLHWTNNPVSPTNRQHGITKVRRKVIEKKKIARTMEFWIVIPNCKKIGTSGEIWI